VTKTANTATRSTRKSTRTQAAAEPVQTSAELAQIEAAKAAAKEAAEQEAWTEAMRVDWAAESSAGAFVGTFEDYLAKQKVDPKSNRYCGRMLALVEARKQYVKGANGNQHSGDFIGSLFSALPREKVVETCIRILKLESNPYYYLNPGQQSMNLRNKVRGALQRGEITVEAIKSQVAAA
jgi:hypothetical protein